MRQASLMLLPAMLMRSSRYWRSASFKADSLKPFKGGSGGGDGASLTWRGRLLRHGGAGQAHPYVGGQVLGEEGRLLAGHGERPLHGVDELPHVAGHS